MPEGDAVPEAMRTARIFGDIATDGGRRLARRVGRKMKRKGLGVGRDFLVQHTDFDLHAAPGGIDCAHFLQAARGQDQRTIRRQGATTEAGATAAGHDRHTGCGTNRHGLDDLLGSCGQGHTPRQTQSHAGRVPGVDIAGGIIIQVTFGPQHGPQSLAQAVMTTHGPPPCKGRPAAANKASPKASLRVGCGWMTSDQVARSAPKPKAVVAAAIISVTRAPTMCTPST